MRSLSMTELLELNKNSITSSHTNRLQAKIVVRRKLEEKNEVRTDDA